MILYGSFTSPYVRHCRIAVEQGGLDCLFQETDYLASATLSPTKRVPLLKDGDLTLTDSSVILRYLREKSNQDFLPCLSDLELFCLCNTALDTAANLFFLERDGFQTKGGDYLERQSSRLTSSLNELELVADSISNDELNLKLDSHLRLVCFLSWGVFRKRFSLAERANLQRLLEGAEEDSTFSQTQPPTK